jgi:hypothetical protein
MDQTDLIFVTEVLYVYTGSIFTLLTGSTALRLTATGPRLPRG